MKLAILTELVKTSNHYEFNNFYFHIRPLSSKHPIWKVHEIFELFKKNACRAQ
jgi:hypothetical protein